MTDNPFRKLPQVARVLDAPALAAARAAHPPDAVTAAVRAELDILRTRLAAGESDGVPSADELAELALARLEKAAVPRIRPVINATGVVLHTNLGRSPLARGGRPRRLRGRPRLPQPRTRPGHRQAVVAAGRRPRLASARLTGAESATAVNNCAAATVIVLRALAAGKEVVVSRGQLIEIGGSFRIPEIMAVSGATLREVGTTNITRLGRLRAGDRPEHRPR